MAERIYLEFKQVSGLPAIHMYLVKRSAPTQAAQIDDLAWRSSGEVLRGGPPAGSGPFGTHLETQSGQLKGSEDRYASSADLGNRMIVDITDDIPSGIQQWSELQSALSRIATSNYDYEVPDFLDAKDHVANSNSTILSILNAVGVDVRSLVNVAVVGASSFSTLLGTQGDLIEASSGLRSGLTLLGRDNFKDILIGTKYGDRFYGEQEADNAATKDTVTYASTTQAVELTLRGSGDFVSRVTVKDVSGTDELVGIEKIVLTSFDDKVFLKSTIPRGIQEIDGGSQVQSDGDIIDVSVIRNARFDAGQLVGTDIKFKNFETIIGGSQSDRIVLAGPRTDAFDIKSIYGEGGDDVIVAGGLTAALFGGDGNDELSAGRGGSVLDGGADNDVLKGGAGKDILFGGSGNDILMGRRGDTEYTGGAGADIFLIERGSGKIVIKDADAHDKLVIRASDVQSRISTRVCPQLSQMIAAARWIAARKFAAVLS